MDHREQRPVLRDLALLYITLAHDTDQDMDAAEADAIAERLRAWDAEAAPETVRSAVGDALEAYVNGDAEAELYAAVARVRDAVPASRRQALVEDLMAVALADDRVLHEEHTFIAQLARAWNVHPNDSGDEAGRRWSILCQDGLSQDGQHGDWTPLHDLALLYISLAHSTDDELATAEVEAITQKLNEWLPGAREVDVLNIVQEAMLAYTSTPHRRTLADAVDSVHRFVPAHQRAALLSDLQHVAHADGVLLEREQLMIDQLARTWNLPATEAAGKSQIRNPKS